MNKIFLSAIFFFVIAAGCKSIELQTPGNGNDELEVVEIGSRVVQAVIAGNYSDFVVASGEKSDEKSADLFRTSREELIKNHGKLCSYRHFGKLDTPLFSNLFFAVIINLTKEHIQLLMGRVDEGSNLWLDADLRQRDRIVFERSAGIETMIERLTGEELFGYVHLVKSERSKTAELADKLN